MPELGTNSTSTNGANGDTSLAYNSKAGRWFVPSTTWQDVPDYLAIPGGGGFEAKINIDTKCNQARWDNPPKPEEVIDKRTGKPQEDAPYWDYVPSSEWQHVPDAYQIPAGYEERTDHAGRRQVRWNHPIPGPETVFVKQTNEPQKPLGNISDFWHVPTFQEYEESCARNEARGGRHLPREKSEINPPGELRPMFSWIDYGDMEIDRSQYHVGDGFLDIGGFIMLIGPSYVGKSTLLAQLTINLAIGCTWLFFRVERPLKILIVQAEDSENKLVKLGRMYRRMGLTAEQIALAKKNTAVLTIRNCQDEMAIAEIERHAEVFKPDVICINPMTSFLSGSVYKDEVINKFLRIELTPMLDRLQASAIVVHHPPKPILGDKETKDLTAFELQYGGAGMAALTNAPRGNVFFVHVDGDVFKLSVGKGFDDLGTKETSAYLRRSRDQADVMLWEPCDQTQATEATENLKQRKSKTKASTSKFVSYDQLLKHLSKIEKYTREKIRALVKEKIDRGKDWTDDALKELVRENKLARTKEKNPEGAAFVLYHLPTVMEPATGPDGQY